MLKDKLYNYINILVILEYSYILILLYNFIDKLFNYSLINNIDCYCRGYSNCSTIVVQIIRHISNCLYSLVDNVGYIRDCLYGCLSSIYNQTKIVLLRILGLKENGANSTHSPYSTNYIMGYSTIQDILSILCKESYGKLLNSNTITGHRKVLRDLYWRIEDIQLQRNKNKNFQSLRNKKNKKMLDNLISFKADTLIEFCRQVSSSTMCRRSTGIAENSGNISGPNRGNCIRQGDISGIHKGDIREKRVPVMGI